MHIIYIILYVDLILQLYRKGIIFKILNAPVVVVVVAQ